MTYTRHALTLALIAMLAVTAACSRRQPAVPAPPRPAPPPTITPTPPPAEPARRPQAVTESEPVTTPALADDDIANRTLDDLNRNSPLRPALFGLDSADLDDQGRQVVAANADILKKFSTWSVTIEGHCDERGTAEYNLALGERRAVSVKTYLVSLGIAPNRIRTVSYGKEFPFDPGHDDSAWAQNRRAHFVITGR
jgi:peptidoglycan-associated lipoprotein